MNIQERVNIVLDKVKSAAPIPGVEEVMLPGERGSKASCKKDLSEPELKTVTGSKHLFGCFLQIKQACLDTGMICVEVNLLRDLRALANKSLAGLSKKSHEYSLSTRLVRVLASFRHISTFSLFFFCSCISQPVWKNAMVQVLLLSTKLRHSSSLPAPLTEDTITHGLVTPPGQF